MGDHVNRTYQETCETITRLAAESFKDHEINLRGEGEWGCSKPGTGTYAFVVLLRPGVVVVWGDLGEHVLRISDGDTLGWLRCAANSPDYLFEKVTASSDPREEFYGGDALRWLQDEPPDEVEAEVTDALREAAEDGAEAWASICYREGIDVAGDFRHPSARMRWLVEALKLFVRLHDAMSNGKGAE